ncbi:hypothetical protein [Sphingomonas oligophenolica]|uniref:DUF697 domain-containing protein n=1 Tax=Sphingomonas oligophenolica TaxID=301154 RepID=A0A502CK21_9SPHN|nr:hypothetical protein [Sphingomonas oligophenolica]TPG12994.1 hypothetical protein EAH84_06100 [Sphingomonas oligophenolica]
MIHDIKTLDTVRRDCRKLVTKRSLMAAGAAVIPIPGADVVADIGLLATLLPLISTKFELDHDQVDKLDPTTVQQVFVVAASLGNNVIGRMVTRQMVVRLLKRFGVRLATASAAKYVPVLGSAVAATIGFGAMKLAGNAHIDDCYKTARAVIDARSAAAVAAA